MATKYYIENNNRYQEISGTEWYKLLQKQKALPIEQKKHFIHFEALSENEDDFYMESPKNQFDAWRRERRHIRYIQEKRQELELIDILYSDFDDESACGEEMLVDQTTDVEETAETNILLERLYAALSQLSAEEYKIVMSLYLSQTPVLQKELAEELHISQQAVSKKIAGVLKKLKSLI